MAPKRTRTAVQIVDSTGKSLPASLSFASPGQINFEIPESAAAGDATLVIGNGSPPSPSAPTSLPRRSSRYPRWPSV